MTILDASVANLEGLQQLVRALLTESGVERQEWARA
jgi:hypothetical protein